MEHPTKKEIDGLINYILSIDINQLREAKDRQHSLVLRTFEDKQVTTNKETKQILVDDAYLSWLLFLRFDMDKSLGEKVDYNVLLANVSSLKKLWCATKARENFEKTGERTYLVTIEDINKDFPNTLFCVCEKAPEQPMLLSSMVIAMDYENVVQTLARKDL